MRDAEDRHGGTVESLLDEGAALPMMQDFEDREPAPMRWWQRVLLAVFFVLGGLAFVSPLFRLLG